MKINSYNPFEKYSQNQLLVLGVLITVLGSILAYFMKGRYDGILDLHFVDKIEFYQPFIDNILNILVASFLLFLLGRIIYSKTRFIDIFNAVLVSRIFIYIATLFNLFGFIGIKTKNLMKFFPETPIGADLLWVLFVGILMLLFMALFLIYLFKGFKVATNSKKNIHIFYFLLTILVSEISLKCIFYILNT